MFAFEMVRLSDPVLYNSSVVFDVTVKTIVFETVAWFPAVPETVEVEPAT